MTGPIAYIVDDLEMNRDLLESLMRTVGIETRSFDGGQSFLEGMNPEHVGCVLMDIRMPGLSGLDAQRELKRRGSVLPVIMVTAHGDVPVAIQAMKDGAYEFIEKPINNQLLLDVVQRAFKHCEQLQSKNLELEEIRKNYENLSPRETQVLEAVVNGRLNKQIAFGWCRVVGGNSLAALSEQVIVGLVRRRGQGWLVGLAEPRSPIH